MPCHARLRIGAWLQSVQSTPLGFALFFTTGKQLPKPHGSATDHARALHCSPRRYIQQGTGGGGTGTSVFRVLRLFRIFQVFKLGGRCVHVCVCARVHARGVCEWVVGVPSWILMDSRS